MQTCTGRYGSKTAESGAALPTGIRQQISDDPWATRPDVGSQRMRGLGHGAR